MKKDPFSSLRIAEFRLFLLLRFAIVTAWSMQFVVVEWEVYLLTKDPLSLGIIGLMEVIPAIGMALFAGHITDQSEKRNLLLKCLFGLGTISVGLSFFVYEGFTGSLSQKTVLWAIYGLVFLGGFVRAFIGPSMFSLIGLVVPKEQYPNAATWSSTTWQVAAVCGSALAGFAIGWIGAFWSLVLVVAFILFAILALLQIEKKPILNPKLGEPMMKSLKEGLSFVFHNKTILNAISLDMFAVLFGGAAALLPIFAQDILKVGSQGFGILRGAPAVGSLLTMLLATMLPLQRKAGKKLLVAVFVFGLCILVFGLSKYFWLSVIALFLSGVADGISVVIRQTILQLYTPDHVRGRVSSVNSIFVGSSNELGAFESGFVSKLIGVVPAVVMGGAITMGIASTTAITAPKFRNLDIEKDLAAD